MAQLLVTSSNVTATHLDQVGDHPECPGFRLGIFGNLLHQGRIVITLPLLWEAFFEASKEVSLCSPGLNWASLNRGLVQGQSE